MDTRGEISLFFAVIALNIMVSLALGALLGAKYPLVNAAVSATTAAVLMIGYFVQRSRREKPKRKRKNDEAE